MDSIFFVLNEVLLQNLITLFELKLSFFPDINEKVSKTKPMRNANTNGNFSIRLFSFFDILVTKEIIFK